MDGQWVKQGHLKPEDKQKSEVLPKGCTVIRQNYNVTVNMRKAWRGEIMGSWSNFRGKIVTAGFIICIDFYTAIYSVLQHSNALAGHPAGHPLPATAPKRQEVGPLPFNVGAQWFAQRAFITKKGKATEDGKHQAARFALLYPDKWRNTCAGSCSGGVSTHFLWTNLCKSRTNRLLAFHKVRL